MRAATVNPTRGDHRQQCVSEHVPQDHPHGMKALGAGGAHVVLANHIEHAGAGQPDDERRVRGRERDGRQQQVAQVGEASLAEDRGIARARQPAQRGREDQYQVQAHPEGRNRRREHGGARQALVEPASVADRGHHSNRKSEDDDPHHRHEGQQDAGLQPVDDQIQHRGLKEDRLSEIAPGDGLEPSQVLGHHGLVQTHLDPHRGDRLRRRQVAEHDRGGVSGDEPYEDEDRGTTPPARSAGTFRTGGSDSEPRSMARESAAAGTARTRNRHRAGRTWYGVERRPGHGPGRRRQGALLRHAPEVRPDQCRRLDSG